MHRVVVNSDNSVFRPYSAKCVKKDKAYILIKVSHALVKSKAKIHQYKHKLVRSYKFDILQYIHKYLKHFRKHLINFINY